MLLRYKNSKTKLTLEVTHGDCESQYLAGLYPDLLLRKCLLREALKQHDGRPVCRPENQL